MSAGRRQMVMYEQIDGSIRIPKDMAICMGFGVGALQVIEGHPITHASKVALTQGRQEAIAQLQFEKEYYKNKYFTCLKQIQDVHELNLCIARKLEVLLQTNSLGIQLVQTQSHHQANIQEDTTQVLIRDKMQKLMGEKAGNSGNGAMASKAEADMVYPPNKRVRHGAGCIDFIG